MQLPEKVELIEVGARDGLQNEAQCLSSTDKVEFINRLSASGLGEIEVTSFVKPGAIPQLADAEQVYRDISRSEGCRYSALVANMRGMERALESNVQAISVVTAATDSFCLHNIHCDVETSLQHINTILGHARSAGIPVRAYISCVFGCPYEGATRPSIVADLSARLLAMGCDEIALGDTIGTATPLQAQGLLNAVARQVPIKQIAVHFHDTYGQALANILACLELGVRRIDSAVAGLGGCPYAAGAQGNVASEDVVYMLQGLGIDCGIDLDRLILAGDYVCQLLNRSTHSRTALARKQEQL